MSLPRFITLEKKVGETPLEVLETWRSITPEAASVPLAYAGRLDPMASGKLLVLIGDECKNQTAYHNLDKTYEVEVLFGAHSDSGDVLGVVTAHPTPPLSEGMLQSVLNHYVGEVEFPYPIFSAKTVAGKPLHTWAMENRLHEITIPTRRSTIYALSLERLTTHTRKDIVDTALRKIETIPPVTDLRKALGNDFRRPLVRESWHTFLEAGAPDDVFYIARVTCTCSSGTYMRTLAEAIANTLGTKGLAFSIHRTEIGTYDKTSRSWSHLF